VDCLSACDATVRFKNARKSSRYGVSLHSLNTSPVPTFNAATSHGSPHVSVTTDTATGSHVSHRQQRERTDPDANAERQCRPPKPPEQSARGRRRFDDVHHCRSLLSGLPSRLPTVTDPDATDTHARGTSCQEFPDTPAVRS
jgi:hypothetical protein